MATTNGGFAGKILRVDLATGKISSEDTVEKYREVLGGTGIGYKVLWEEVPAGTGSFDAANKIIFATGVLAGIGVQGSGPVRIAGDKTEWERLVKVHLSILGGNNQHVVPSFPHPQSEYYNPNSRWVGAPGKSWGAAEPPVEITGGLYDLNRIAFRANNAAFYLGDNAWKYTVRGNGCTGCPIRCHTIVKVPAVAAKYGIREIAQNTCGGLVFGRSFFKHLSGGLKARPLWKRAWSACTWPTIWVSGAITANFSVTS